MVVRFWAGRSRLTGLDAARRTGWDAQGHPWPRKIAPDGIRFVACRTMVDPGLFGKNNPVGLAAMHNLAVSVSREFGIHS
jgi:hypothetical protein